MTNAQPSNGFFSCASGDTKPTTAPAGSFLVETDTYQTFIYTGSAWVLSAQKPADVTKVTGDSPYTITASDYVIRADASSGSLTVTLPTAVGRTGKTYVIKRIDNLASSVLVTIATTSSQTIDGATAQYLWNAENMVVESDGANWVMLTRNHPETLFSYMLKGSTANRRYAAATMGQYAGTPVTSTTSLATNTLWALPFMLPKTTKFDTISFNITSVSTAGNSRVGIYRDSGNMYPGVLYFDSGAIVTTATGLKDTTITSGLQVFPAGLYWLAYEQDTATGQMICVNGSGAIDAILGLSSTMTTAPSYGYSVAHTFGALPDPYTASATLLTTNPAAATPIPMIGLRPI